MRIASNISRGTEILPIDLCVEVPLEVQVTRVATRKMGQIFLPVRPSLLPNIFEQSIHHRRRHSFRRHCLSHPTRHRLSHTDPWSLIYERLEPYLASGHLLLFRL